MKKEMTKKVISIQWPKTTSQNQDAKAEEERGEGVRGRGER